MERPTVEDRPETLVIGMSVRTSNNREMIPGEGKIGATWETFQQAGGASSIPGATEDKTMMGVYSDYEKGGDGEYTLIIGAEVTTLDDIPKERVGVRIPAGRYARFDVKGAIPEGLIETWGGIWKYFESSKELKRAFTIDYERFRANGKVAIYVAIRD